MLDTRTHTACLASGLFRYACRLRARIFSIRGRFPFGPMSGAGRMRGWLAAASQASRITVVKAPKADRICMAARRTVRVATEDVWAGTAAGAARLETAAVRDLL